MRLGRMDAFLRKQATKTEKDSMGMIEKFVSNKMREHEDRPPSKQKKIQGVAIKSRFPIIGGNLQSSSNLKKSK